MAHYRLTLIALCSLFLAGCNSEDDLQEIFTGKEWHLAGFYETHDWDNHNAGVPINEYNSLSDLSAYNVIFYTDGMVVVTLPQGCKIQGRWEADGAKRTFITSDWKTVTGSPASLTGYGKLMYDNIRNIAYYQGNSNYIRLFDDSRKNFMQFADRSIFNP